ncbi:MAG: hypothetical protein HC908_09155 [Calothrix sp. SM1_7_51]|nr:hypothetical protein [Calothrix sp. SM1_7_51]
MADYVSRQSKKIAIFYSQKSSYSESLTGEFLKILSAKQQVKTLPPNNLTAWTENSSSFNPNNLVAISLVGEGADAAFFAPRIKDIETVIDIIKAQEKLYNLKRLKEKSQLFGGDSLYGETTLKNGQSAIEGLTLAIPYFVNPLDSNIAKIACIEGQNRVNWRTAAAYDATRAFLKAISISNPAKLTRQEILKNLSTVQLGANETFSGKPLRFLAGESYEGSILKQPVLVKVVKGENKSCDGYDKNGLHFQKVD